MARGGRRDLHNDWQERKLRKAAVAAHLEQVGAWCPGWNKPAHRSLDLTADHPVPVGVGGQPTGQTYMVLCRSCNASRGKRMAGEQAQLPSVRSRDWLSS